MRGAPHEIKMTTTHTLTRSTNRKYNEKCYKDYELWQGQSRTRDHVHGISTSNLVTHKSRYVSLR